MDIFFYGEPNADIVLVQMVDDHDLSVIEEEASHIQNNSDTAFYLIAIKVNDWNDDLSPWSAPAVYGDKDFGGGAEDTLDYLLSEVLSSIPDINNKRTCIGGYSLAGLFALWVSTKTDVFDSVVAASPSVWYPGFVEYMRNAVIFPDTVYLSLGDKEEKTKNKVMAQVGDSIREIHRILTERGCRCELEWNPGNHFRDPQIRTAKGFEWALASIFHLY